MSTILAVHAFRRGTGKSNLIANLAVSLARYGNRVGVLDMARPSRLHALLGVDECALDPVWIHSLWHHDQGADQIPLNSVLQVERGSVAVLDSGIALTPIPSARAAAEVWVQQQMQQDPASLSRQLMEMCDRLQLDYLLIDAQSGIHEEGLLPMAIADILLLVLCLESSDYQGTAVLVDLARQLQVPQVQLVANQVAQTYNAPSVIRELEDIYGHKVTGVLPFSQELFATRGQTVFCQRYPDHPWSLEVGAIAREIMIANSRVAKQMAS